MRNNPPDDAVKVRLRLRPGEGRPSGEWKWALPVDAHDGGGVYELMNIANNARLGLFDRVLVGLEGDSFLQVVDIVQPAYRMLSVTTFDPRVSDRDRAAAGDAWAARGATWSEGCGAHSLFTTWDEGVTLAGLREVVDETRSGGTRCTIVEAVDPEHRTRDHQHTLDFDHEPPQLLDVTTTYWAADDPYWAVIGMHNPDWLATSSCSPGTTTESLDASRTARPSAS